MNQSVSVSPAAEKVLRRSGTRDSALLLVVAWFLPLGIHLLPWSGPAPLGAYLLPMFWVTLVAVYLYGTGVGLLIGLTAPLVNGLITGFPSAQFLSVLAFELAVFAIVTRGLIRNSPGFWLSGPFGYVAAKVASTAVQSLFPVFGGLGEPSSFFLRSVQTALPGLLALGLIHLALVKIHPLPDDWDAT